jgi:hypothetical protein
MGILNHDTGAALAADKAMITAAGQGFVADAMDVSGNNIAIGGATYVGTATTVSTATSVHGIAQGTIPVTANPNIANGTGGTAATPPTGTPPTGTPPTGTPPSNPGGCHSSCGDHHGHGHDHDDHHSGPTAAAPHVMHELLQAEAVAHQMHWA